MNLLMNNKKHKKFIVIIVILILYLSLEISDYKQIQLNSFRRIRDNSFDSANGIEILNLSQAGGYSELKIGRKAKFLAELHSLGIPVPEALVLPVDGFYAFKESGDNLPEEIIEEIKRKISILEEKSGKRLGDRKNPLLLSLRSSPIVSMPGFLPTILNLGINEDILPGLIDAAGGGEMGERFAYDTYLRFIEGYVEAVYREKISSDFFRQLKAEFLKQCGKEKLYELTNEQLGELIQLYKIRLAELGISIPSDPYEQLKQAITAIYRSLSQEKIITFFETRGISFDKLASGVIIQRMVFGNLNHLSGAGIAFTRNFEGYGKGNPTPYHPGFFLIGSQGDDIVNPDFKQSLRPFIFYTKEDVEKGVPIERHGGLRLSPEIAQVNLDLARILWQLVDLYPKPQEIEFTFENGKLYILQIRPASISVLGASGLGYDFEEPIRTFQRIETVAQRPWKVYKYSSYEYLPVTRPISPGVVKGYLAFSVDEAERFYQENKPPILVLTERDDKALKMMMEGKIAGIIFGYGNEVMHEAVIANAFTIPAILESIRIEADKLIILGKEYRRGEKVTLDGNLSKLYKGFLPEEKLLYPLGEGEFFGIDASFDKIKETAELEAENRTLEELIQLRNEYWLRSLAVFNGEIQADIFNAIIENLKAHFLHEIILKIGQEQGLSQEEIEKKINEALKAGIDIRYYTRDELKIGGKEFEVLYEHTIWAIIQDPKEMPFGAILNRTIPAKGEFEGRILISFGNIIKPTGYSSVEREEIDRERIEREQAKLYKEIEEFLEFSRHKLEQEGRENYLFMQEFYFSRKVYHAGDIFNTITFYGVAFPEERYQEVLELIAEWLN